jgi:hypothetical protein
MADSEETETAQQMRQMFGADAAVECRENIKRALADGKTGVAAYWQRIEWRVIQLDKAGSQDNGKAF